MDPVLIGVIAILFCVTGATVFYTVVLPAIQDKQRQQARLEVTERPQLTDQSSDDFNQKLRALTDGVINARFTALEDKLVNHFNSKMMPELQRAAEGGSSVNYFWTMKQIQMIEGTYKDDASASPKTDIDKGLITLVARRLYDLFKEHKVKFDWFKIRDDDIEFIIKW